MKKLTALAIALTMLLSFAACNSEGGGSAEADVATTAKTEKVKDETTTAKTEETTVPEETTTKETTTTEEVTEPVLEVIEPPAEDFEYKYDAALKGAVITGYKGEAEAIRIPTELDGDPVVSIKIQKRSLQQVEIPDSVNVIEESAFSGCENLKSVIIPNSVTEIRARAFQSCESLEAIELPDSITLIGEYAFLNCENLKNINIPNGTVDIGVGAFSYCESIENITIPNSVTAIGQNAFSGCINLKKIEIPESVEKFGYYNSGVAVGNNVFDDSGIEEIIISPNIEWEVFGGFGNCNELKKINIPDGVIKIQSEALRGCEKLEEVVIPDSVEYIGDRAFGNCSSLKEVTLPDGVILNGEVFIGCTSLRNLTLPDNVSYNLGNIFFSNCDGLTVTYKGNEYNYTNFNDLYIAIPYKVYTE